MINSIWPWPTSLIFPFPMIKPEQQETIGEMANKQGIRFLHLQGKEVSCTVAYRPVVKYPKSKMLEISVAYKHPKDQFNKKIGCNLAAERFLNKETITLPIRGKNNAETLQNIAEIFLDSVERIRHDSKNSLFW